LGRIGTKTYQKEKGRRAGNLLSIHIAVYFIDRGTNHDNKVWALTEYAIQ